VSGSCRGPVTGAIKSRPGIAGSIEEELLQLFARQSRHTPIPVALIAGMIVGLAYNYAPLWLLLGWFGLVVVVLTLRSLAIGRLPTFVRLSVAARIRLVAVLAAATAAVHALSLTFFPFLPELACAVQSFMLIALCVGAVTSLAGYMPVYLAYVLPILIPLTAVWVVIGADGGWVEGSMAAWVALSGVFCVARAGDAFRAFRDGFRIRAEQAELNRQLQRALEQTEAASRAKTRFLASASHDLRQPIHTVSLFGAALTMRPLDPQTREIAQHLNTALQILASQLDALLDISKLDAKVVRVDPVPLKLPDVLARLCKEFEPSVRAKGLALEFSCAETGFVETDQLLFERVIRNLLDNAVKYTDRGSIRVDVGRRGANFEITIEDTGRGIPKSEHGRVFEEFYQLDNPERDRSRGLGLGLSIVQRLTGLLQIHMGMDSAPGCGTRFRLHLPVAQPRPDAARTPFISQTPRALEVLVVDDEAGVRLGMKTLLEGMACCVSLADGTAQAVELARKNRPDIVLTDLRLRGEDNGIETVRAIRKLYPAVPAILISGDIAPERLRQAEAAGIPLLHKPVSVDLLRQALAQAVSSANPRHDANRVAPTA
jgi:signal transduction histidine kinase/ActR/RegA family two-component response regulator